MGKSLEQQALSRIFELVSLWAAPDLVLDNF
jgi:hypothetical protein